MTHKNILVIRHGALGDLIMATGAFAAIRRAHPEARITLLTGPSFKGFAQKMGFFDDIWTDGRSKNPLHIWQTVRAIARARFDFVYDLQNSSRTGLYFRLLSLMGARPLWNGIAPGCSHPQTRPDREELHSFWRYHDQLKCAGLSLEGEVLLSELSWMEGDLSDVALPEKFVILIPGSSLSGSYKRWDAASYAALAAHLRGFGVESVLVAGPEDTQPVEYLRQNAPEIVDLSMKLSLFQIASLARRALAVVGNDTGPTHIASGVRTPTVVPWALSAAPPHIYAPKGDHVRVVGAKTLDLLPLEDVLSAFFELIPQKTLDSKGQRLASSS